MLFPVICGFSGFLFLPDFPHFHFLDTFSEFLSLIFYRPYRSDSSCGSMRRPSYHSRSTGHSHSNPGQNQPIQPPNQPNQPNQNPVSVSAGAASAVNTHPLTTNSVLFNNKNGFPNGINLMPNVGQNDDLIGPIGGSYSQRRSMPEIKPNQCFSSHMKRNSYQEESNINVSKSICQENVIII